MWGVASEGGIDNSPNINGDPAGDPVNVTLSFDTAWDLSDPQEQANIVAQLDDLKNRGDLFTDITANPLDRRASLPD